MAKRMQGNGFFGDAKIVDERGEWTGNIVYKPERLDMPYHWKKPQVVAVNWIGDMFHENVPPEVWPAVYKVMAETPRHTYLVLTKRYDEMFTGVEQKPLPNVYLGATVSCRKDYAEAYASLYALHLSGWKTWVSFEPALEEVMWVGLEWLNGMVCGGESGNKARPMPIQAAYGARDFCRLYHIPFTFKQFSDTDGRNKPPLLDGRQWQQFPSGFFSKTE
jgi:protein gp37